MSESTFFIEIVTPEKVVASDDFESAELPGTHGEFQVLSGHTPFLTDLKIGAVTLTKGTKKTILSITGGYCEVLPEKTTVIAHTAEHAKEIDRERAEAAEKRARKRLDNIKTDSTIDEDRAKLSLFRAINRLSVAKLK